MKLNAAMEDEKKRRCKGSALAKLTSFGGCLSQNWTIDDTWMKGAIYRKHAPDFDA